MAVEALDETQVWSETGFGPQESDGQFLLVKAVWQIEGGFVFGINWVVYQAIFSCFPQTSHYKQNQL